MFPGFKRMMPQTAETETNSPNPQVPVDGPASWRLWPGLQSTSRATSAVTAVVRVFPAFLQTVFRIGNPQEFGGRIFSLI